MRYTHQTISTLTDQVLQAAEQFRQRPLPEELALVYLDGLFLKVLGEEGVERSAVYVALGITPAGERQVWTNPFGTGKARAPSWATGSCPARTL
jgi:transposase-like protein